MKMINYQKNIIVFGINSVKVLRKNLIVNPSTIKKLLKNKVGSYGHEAIDFYDTEVPKKDSNYTCLSIILIDFVFKNDDSYYPQVFLKGCKYTKKKKKKIGYMMT